jgi:hypothetical protein
MRIIATSVLRKDLALKDREIVVGDLQNDAGHARAVFDADGIAPRSVLGLA